MSSITRFEIPPTPELLSSHSSDSSNDAESFFPLLVASNCLAIGLHKDAVSPLRKERIKSDARTVSPSKNAALQLDELRNLPPLDTNLIDYERATLPTSAATLPDNSQVSMLNSWSRSYPVIPSYGITRRASDKGPTNNLEREKGVSMLSLPSTPFPRQDLPRDTSNPWRSRTIKFLSPRSVSTLMLLSIYNAAQDHAA